MSRRYTEIILLLLGITFFVICIGFAIARITFPADTHYAADLGLITEEQLNQEFQEHIQTCCGLTFIIMVLPILIYVLWRVKNESS